MKADCTQKNRRSEIEALGTKDAERGEIYYERERYHLGDD